MADCWGQAHLPPEPANASPSRPHAVRPSPFAAGLGQSEPWRHLRLGAAELYGQLPLFSVIGADHFVSALGPVAGLIARNFTLGREKREEDMEMHRLGAQGNKGAQEAAEEREGVSLWQVLFPAAPTPSMQKIKRWGRGTELNRPDS